MGKHHSNFATLGMALVGFAMATACSDNGGSQVEGNPGDEPKVSVSNDPKVLFNTSEGDVVIELFQEKAPETVANFLAYVKSGFYDHTIFHRVISGFVVQGGGFTAQMQLKPTAKNIQNEAHNGLKNLRGTLAMARTGDPHSASSQFFINLSDNSFLDFTGKNQQGWGYAVFGKVTQGMSIVDKIADIPTGKTKGHRDVPKQPVTIEKAELLKQ